MTVTSITKTEEIIQYIQRQPAFSCCHFVARIGTNVSQEWYDPKVKKKICLSEIKKDLFVKMLQIKYQKMKDASPNIQICIVGVATPPCYDLSVANPTREEGFCFSTMTVAFNLLHHCYHTAKLEFFKTYTIEMVAHARHKELVEWARKGSRKHHLCWDYVLACDLKCPTNRERCFFKPKNSWDCPFRLGKNIIDLNIGEVLGIHSRSKRIGLKGTTWGNLDGRTTSMSERGFTITGSLPRLHYTETNGYVREDLKSRSCSPDEQLGLMGFPPSLRKLIVWSDATSQVKKAKWIGSGIPLHMGVAIAYSILEFVAGTRSECSAMINFINYDFICNTIPHNDW